MDSGSELVAPAATSKAPDDELVWTREEMPRKIVRAGASRDGAHALEPKRRFDFRQAATTVPALLCSAACGRPPAVPGKTALIKTGGSAAYKANHLKDYKVLSKHPSTTVTLFVVTSSSMFSSRTELVSLHKQRWFGIT